MAASTEAAKANIETIVPFKQSEIPKEDHLINAFRWSKKLVSLPIYPSLRKTDAKRIAKVVSNVIETA